ncbi:MAG: type B 50S ribosomal protein L31 [Bifidobacterium tibiigranuli]|jgi:large subunit ribosomal protein L31|uniref:type B 50S ribosomal protein L31 n=1 Tax=Bifidobacterium tibiigranuli TaxID=2172043 RepID=UPI0026EB4385|nr:type B 50S ribosomal protein L31 [Bifidobacterium tibiigranuli]MCI1673854.1 type B 50S ribosomal protein L31 [Bifidobacterium tibiigranuli]MCI1712103.1 type B 50S ribosomal protein L31 [Bifidobacterium tibiigranuli]MCI1833838.1 type B 50S ribosomal protein L31 [Bifidobacterium tibiigranuli]
MKTDIHPAYGYVVFHDRSADRSFLTKSTLVAKASQLPTIEWEDGNTYPLVNVEVSSYSHPFYTGKNVVLDTAGQVQKFNARYGKRTKSQA